MNESEIRPAQIFAEYLRLAELDTHKYFGERPRQSVLCPACGARGIFSFNKHGFSYEECPVCQTLFVSPRPPAEAFSRYYKESDSVKFWASTFYKETAEARREKLWRPKARILNEMLQSHKASQYALLDIGGGYGIFAEEYQRLTGSKVTVIEPGTELANVCRQKGLTVVEAFLEEMTAAQLPTGPKAFVSFELFEHLHDPEMFIKHLKSLMKTGDLFLFTTLSGVGVDIQALWNESKSVSPPHHLNFLNPKSVRLLLERVGLQVLDVRTPGKLDMDILINNLDHIKDRFWHTFALQATEQDKEQWQNFISSNGWSSHMMVLCQQP